MWIGVCGFLLVWLHKWGWDHKITNLRGSFGLGKPWDMDHPETWPFIPLWRRLILPVILYVPYTLTRIGCHPSPATPGTFLAILAAFLLYTLSIWGIYYKNPFLTTVLGNRLKVNFKTGLSITLSRFWFILPALIALFILYWTGRDVSIDCSLA